jgi:hypothetical protein
MYEGVLAVDWHCGADGENELVVPQAVMSGHSIGHLTSALPASEQNILYAQ